MSLGWRIAQYLGLVLAALSLFSLFRQFLEVGLAGPVRLVLEYYQQFLHVVLGWADEPLKRVVASIRAVIELPVKVDPNWKHLFVLLWLCFSSDAKTNWETRKGFATFSIVLGAVVALLTSVVSLEGEGHELIRAAAPMLAIVVWETIRNCVSSALLIPTPAVPTAGKRRGQVFRQRFVSYAVPILAVGAVADIGLWLAFRAGWLPFVRDFSTFALTAFVLLMALYWMGRALMLGRFTTSGTAYLGRLMLSTLAGAAMFLLVNAGLQKMGL